MMTLLLVGLLLLGTSMVSLVFAITHAENGSEDSAGFHRDLPAADAHQGPTADTKPWDHVEGASCPLNLTP
jgi:hypothetical protein